MGRNRRTLRSKHTAAAGAPLRFRHVGLATLAEARALASRTARELSRWGLPAERVADWEVAVAEMATNISRHSYPGGAPGPIELDVVWDRRGLTISIEDEGVGFDPELVREPPEPDPDDPSTWPEGGMGLMIVRSAGDRLTYATRAGRHVLSLFTSIPRT